MSRAWMPLYIADYAADTAHLNATESGAYLHLIMHYWQTGGLPDDPSKLARIARLTARQWTKLESVIKPFFHDGWKHKRIDAELTKACDISEKRKAAADKRHGNNDASAPANAVQVHTQSQSPSPKKEEKKESVSGGRPKATRPEIDEAFERFWKAYPRRKGANPKKPARALFEAATRQGVDPEQIISALNASCGFDPEKIGTEFTPQAVKWLRDRRWEDFVEAPLASDAADPNLQAPPGAPSHEELLKRHAVRNNQPSSEEILRSGQGGYGPEGHPDEERKQGGGVPDDPQGDAGVRRLGTLFRLNRMDAGSYENGSGRGAGPRRGEADNHDAYALASVVRQHVR